MVVSASRPSRERSVLRCHSISPSVARSGSDTIITARPSSRPGTRRSITSAAATTPDHRAVGGVGDRLADMVPFERVGVRTSGGRERTCGSDHDERQADERAGDDDSGAEPTLRECDGRDRGGEAGQQRRGERSLARSGEQDRAGGHVHGEDECDGERDRIGPSGDRRGEGEHDGARRCKDDHDPADPRASTAERTRTRATAVR